MSESENGREVMVGTYLPPAVAAELKAAAKHDRRSQSAYLQILIERDLAKRRKKRSNRRKAA